MIPLGLGSLVHNTLTKRENTGSKVFLPLEMCRVHVTIVSDGMIAPHKSFGCLVDGDMRKIVIRQVPYLSSFL